jgi:outer membrane immunogenic protein
MRAAAISTAALLAGTTLSGAAYAQAGISPPLATAYNWTGFYIGTHGGGAWGDEDDGDFGECGPFTNFLGEDGDDIGTPDCFFAGFPDDGPNDGDGPFPSFELDDDYVAWTGADSSSGDDVRGLFGGHAGYNIQSGRLVFGIEGDISGVFGDGGSQEVTFDYFHDTEGGLPIFGCDFGCDLELYEGTGTVRSDTAVEWLATVRGRIGAALDAQGRFLLYGTGGLAIAGVENSISGEFDELGGKNDAVDFCQDGCFFEDADEGDDTQLGIAVGVGGEYAFTNNMSFGLQYLYTHFDESDGNSITFVGDDGRQFDVELGGGIEDLHSVTARWTWRFGAPPTP